MATYREMIYMVIDQLKLISDDSYYTEEHMLFLIKRMRAILIDRKFSNARVVSSMPDANYQTLNIKFGLKPAVRGNMVFESDSVIPELTKAGIIIVYPECGMQVDRMSFIPVERLPFVRHSKWLKSFVYIAYGSNRKLLISPSGHMGNMQNVKIRGVFADPEAAAEFEEGYDGNILDWRFPLDDAMHAQCIEMVVQELSGARYAPYDKKNNAADDNDIATKQESSKTAAPAVQTAEQQQ